jgi:DNA-binding LacI/PurR family transcriptional regulator
VTLQTIADALGVSRTTVSNAYNRPDQLNAELRRRILAKASELGYAGPDPAARRLRRGEAGAVGLLLTERLSYAFSDPAAVGFLEGLAARCEEVRAALLLLPLLGDDRAGEVVRGAVVDALCAYSMPDAHPALDAARERGLPMVTVDAPRLSGVPFVGIDDRGGMRSVGEHLVGLGHRRFGILVPTLVLDGREGAVGPERLARAAYEVDRNRIAGLRDALDDAGIAWDTVLIQERAQRQEAGAAGADALLDADPSPTAIVATTDELALGALRGAQARGLDVPGDVSIAGFDDIPDAARAHPPLTTLRQPLVEKGRVAGGALLDGSNQDVLLPVELVARESTGRAPTS